MNVLEGAFCEVRHDGVLGGSFALPTHVHFALKRKEDDQEMSAGSESTGRKAASTAGISIPSTSGK
jgi:hypothetical protein